MTIPSRSPIRQSRGHAFVLACAVLWGPATHVLTQSIDVATANGAVHIRASGLTLIDAASLARLKDGRSIRVDLDLGVLPAAGAAVATRARQTFVVSYDLWEERFAVTQAGPPSRSISHLTAAAADAWCLAQVSIPLVALGRLGSELPFWIRLEYRVLNVDNPSTQDSEEGFTLRALIDALSRRRAIDDSTRAIEAGPFRLKK